MMKNYLRNLSIVLVCSLFLGSCETEFELVNNEPLKPIVYCLINPYDSIHYARIEKSVKGKGGVLTQIQNSDSLYFEGLNVELVGLKNLNEVWKYRMHERTWEKEPGIFASDDHRLYVLERELNNEIDSIQIVVHDLADQMLAQSRIKQVNQNYFSSPKPWESQIGFYREKPYMISFGGLQLTITVHLTEFYEDSVSLKSISWTTLDGFDPDSPGYKLTEERFFNRLKMSLRDGQEVQSRVLRSIDFEGLRWSQDVQDYMDTWLLRAESDYPPFSNLENAWGIFASFATVKKTGMILDYISNDSLCNGRLTKGLKFRNW